MGTLEQIRQASLRELAGLSGPCITIVLAGDEKGDTRVELKEALHTVRRELAGLGDEADTLLQPITAASMELHSNTKARGPIVILRSREIFVMERDGSPPGTRLKSLAKVGDHFDVRTLVTLLSQVSRFYVLALSQNHTRMLECSKGAYHDVPWPPDFASSLTDLVEVGQPGHVPDLQSFVREIERAVNVVLRGHEEPLVVVGVENEIALYRRVNTYPHFEGGIHGSPDSLEDVEMHRRALELLNSRPDEAVRRALEDFDKKVGSGHASTHMQEILPAARTGRIAWMFLRETAHYPGTTDPLPAQVKPAEGPLEGPSDLIEDAALQTLSHGGDVRVLPESAMPTEAPVCAVFRWAAAQLPYAS